MKKMIVRADDVGYTIVNNIGAFESIENGVVTSADVMLDCPGTIDALERLKDMPWTYSYYSLKNNLYNLSFLLYFY